MNRLRTAATGERGSVITTMIFIIVATGLIGSMLGLYLMRTTHDYATARQAEVKSVISELAGAVVNKLNTDFPTEWLTLTDTELAAVTENMAVNAEQQASAHLVSFTQDSANGTITARVIGDSTAPGKVRVFATITATPTGAAVFEGLDANQRPIWIYSNGSVDTLALYELTPAAVQYQDVNGTSTG